MAGQIYSISFDSIMFYQKHCMFLPVQNIFNESIDLPFVPIEHGVCIFFLTRFSRVLPHHLLRLLTTSGGRGALWVASPASPSGRMAESVNVSVNMNRLRNYNILQDITSIFPYSHGESNYNLGNIIKTYSIYFNIWLKIIVLIPQIDV